MTALPFSRCLLVGAILLTIAAPSLACDQDHLLASKSPELALDIKPDLGKVQTTNVFMPYQALLCDGSGVERLSTVVTGVRDGETVHLFASSDHDVASNLAANAKLRIGRRFLTLISQVDSSQGKTRRQAADDAHLRYRNLASLEEVVAVATTAVAQTGETPVQAVATGIDLHRLRSAGFDLSDGQRFYLQAVLATPGGEVRLTPLSEVRIGPCATPAL